MSVVPAGNKEETGVLGGPSSEPAAAWWFNVEVDGISLGSFTGCEGLSAENAAKDYEEGGVNGYVHWLPSRLKYTNIKLSRVLDGTSASGESLAAWFSKFGKGSSRDQVKHNVGIKAFTASGIEVGTWSLKDAVPVRWTGPSFTSDGSGAAKETLEFAHRGFM
jgi:phage tail-like protein